jgi:hypothetical protein
MARTTATSDTTIEGVGRSRDTYFIELPPLEVIAGQ